MDSLEELSGHLIEQRSRAHALLAPSMAARLFEVVTKTARRVAECLSKSWQSEKARLPLGVGENVLGEVAGEMPETASVEVMSELVADGGALRATCAV